MGDFTPTKHDASTINNGVQFNNGDIPQKEAFNNTIENSLYSVKQSDEAIKLAKDAYDNAVAEKGTVVKIGGVDQAIVNLEDEVSNPNLLINPDFKINQRGVYNVSNNINRDYVYLMDRWCTTSNNVNYTQNTNSITLSNSNQHSIDLRQLLANPTSFAGKDVTVSLRIRKISGSNNNVLLRIFQPSPSPIDKFFEITLSQTMETYSFNYKMPNNTHNELAFFIEVKEGQYEIEWAKLEYGKIATKFEEPEPITELAKCQRYCINLKNANQYRSYLIGSGVIYSTSFAYISISVPTSLRQFNGHPTLIVDKNDLTLLTGASKNLAGSTFTNAEIIGNNSNSITLRIQSAFDSNVVGNGTVLRLGDQKDFIIDAEL